MSLVEQSLSWVRQTFSWSNSLASWRERLVGWLFLGIAAALAYLTAYHLVAWQSAIVWTVYALALAFVSGLGWIKLLGPVLFYDMVRTSRRSRYSIIRIFYGGFLFVILLYLYLILMVTPRFGREVQARDTAMLAELFFATFMIVQLVMIVLLTPAYVAGAIADEKDRKTLEFLLATDLHNREIVLSKLLSRLANLTLLVLIGLPILSILQLIGGVDPELMLAGFAGVGLTMLGIASISILASTLFKKPRDAISLTYLFLITYASFSLFAMAMQWHPIMAAPLWFGENPPTPRDVAAVLDAGNPISAIIDVASAINGRTQRGAATSLAAELPGILKRYAWFHLVLSFVCITWSIVRVRAVALKQGSGGKTATLGWWEHFRPRVGNLPMLWKEFYIDGRTKFNWLVWLAILVLVAITLGSGIWILADSLSEPRRGFPRIGESMNIWFRFAGTSVGCLTLLMIGVRASTSLTSERERDTFDALIATPMSAESILLAKVVGNVTGMRPAWLWFASLMLLALFTGGLHPLSIPFLISTWLVYALFVTLLGIWFSMLCKSSIWSAMFTVAATLVLGGAHWLFTSCFCMPVFGLLAFAMDGNRQNEALMEFGKYALMFQAGLTPPFVFAWFSVPLENRMDGERFFWELFGFSVLGTFLWTIACTVLWFGFLVPRFRQIARRNELE